MAAGGNTTRETRETATQKGIRLWREGRVRRVIGDRYEVRGDSGSYSVTPRSCQCTADVHGSRCSHRAAVILVQAKLNAHTARKLKAARKEALKPRLKFSPEQIAGNLERMTYYSDYYEGGQNVDGAKRQENGQGTPQGTPEGTGHTERKGQDMAIKFTASDFSDFEAGIYRAKLAHLETAEGSIVDEKTGENRLYMKWTFELLEEGYEGRELRGNSSMAFGSRAKARSWAEALVGRRISSGETVSEEDLIGKECDLMVTLEETDRGTFAKVESVNPVRKKKKGGQVTVPDESDFDDLPLG